MTAICQIGAAKKVLLSLKGGLGADLQCPRATRTSLRSHPSDSGWFPSRHGTTSKSSELKLLVVDGLFFFGCAPHHCPWMSLATESCSAGRGRGHVPSWRHTTAEPVRSRWFRSRGCSTKCFFWSQCDASFCRSICVGQRAPTLKSLAPHEGQSLSPCRRRGRQVLTCCGKFEGPRHLFNLARWLNWHCGTDGQHCWHARLDAFAQVLC